jgi:hypothetical protein
MTRWDDRRQRREEVVESCRPGELVACCCAGSRWGPRELVENDLPCK